MESTVVTIIVHSAKNLQAKKKGSHKFSVDFGIGDQKYHTDVVNDPAGCPTFGGRCDIKLQADHESVFFVVKEKHSTLGQVVVPIKFVPAQNFHKVTTAALQPHKKNPNPVGLLIYEVWTSKQETPIKSNKSPLAKLKNQLKSPNLSRGFSSTLKPYKKDGNGNLLKTRTKSISLTDIRDSSESPSENKITTKSASRSPVFAIGRSLRNLRNSRDDGGPVIHSIWPSQGSCLGGTVLTIEGENLGKDPQDILALEVGGTDCSLALKYISPQKLEVTTKAHKPGEGYVSIKTLSSGRTTSNDPFLFVNDTPGSSGSKKKGSFWQGELSLKNDGKYVTVLEEELEKLRKENKELKDTNADMVVYIDRLVARLLTKHPDALVGPLNPQ